MLAAALLLSAIAETGCRDASAGTVVKRSPGSTSSSVPVPTVTTLGSPGQDITASGLNGDVDVSYLIYFYVIGGASGSGAISFQPNGASSNQRIDIVYFNGTFSPGSTGDVSALTLETSVPVGSVVQGYIRFRAKSGGRRYMSYDLYSDNGPMSKTGNGWWGDIGANVTQVTLHAGTAAGFAAGSYIEAVRGGGV